MPTFFVDRSLGRRDVPMALRGAGYAMAVHDEHFAQNARDEEWLREAGRQGWIVLTKDTRIERRPLERQALLHFQVAVCVLVSGGLNGAEMGRILVQAAPAILEYAAQHSPPWVLHVYRNGDVQPFALA